jgi:glycosyltransferase 2 family protein
MMFVQKYGILVLKVVLTLASLAYIFYKVPFSDLWLLVKNVEPNGLVMAFVFFVISKIVSSHRQWVILARAGTMVEYRYNLKLYWLGMFYNQFLPSGIGGDAYKMLHLAQEYGESKKKMASLLFLDRLSGLMALVVLAIGLLAFILPFQYKIVCVLFVPLGYVVYAQVLRLVGYRSHLLGLDTELLSVMVQLAQLASAWFLLCSFGTTQLNLHYLFLFLCSSVASVLPISVGGLGLRELVFLTGANYLDISKEIAVGLGFLFYGISFLASAWGLVYVFMPIKPVKTTPI